MNPRLYNSSGDLVAVLDNIIKTSARIKRVVNGEFTFSYMAHEAELKSEYFQPNNNIIIDGQTFDLKYVELSHIDKTEYTIEAEHAIYRLADGVANKFEDGYTYLGTPTEILTDLTTGTDFSVGTVDFTDIITLSINEEVSRKATITYLANYVGGELDFRDDGFTIDILDTIGADNGYQARFGRNLKGVTKIMDGRDDEVDTYYKVDLLALRESNGYIYADLEALDNINIGDTIRIIDDVTGIDVENRVLSINYNPVLNLVMRVEITNTIELITDAITDIQTNVVYKGKEYNKVSITSEYGFRSELASQLARTTLSGGTISMDKGDGIGGYTPVLYFDVTEQTFVFDGLLSADVIEAIEANIGVVVSNTMITNVLSAQYGDIARLTVDRLETANKIKKYYYSDTDDLNFVRIEQVEDGQYDYPIIDLITGSVDFVGEVPQTIAFSNGFGDLLYYTTNPATTSYADLRTTTEVTDWAVTVYDYTELRKGSLRFEWDADEENYIQMMQLGAGTGTGDYGKYLIKKLTSMVTQYYYNESAGAIRGQKHTNADVNHIVGDETAHNHFTKTNTFPTGVGTGSTSTLTSDLSNCDIPYLTADPNPLDLLDGSVIYIAGSITITLPEISDVFTNTPSVLTEAGVVFRIFNIGATASTLARGGTDTINNGNTTRSVPANDGLTVIVRRGATDWKVM